MILNTLSPYYNHIYLNNDVQQSCSYLKIMYFTLKSEAAKEEICVYFLAFVLLVKHPVEGQWSSHFLLI